MNDLSGRVAALTPEQRAQLSARLGVQAAKTAAVTPVAVIGVGCRFPGGGESPEEFWRALCAGVDGVRTAPAERWDADRFFSADTAAPGKTNSRWGGFLNRIDEFDREFFGFSPREAMHMDPQQRLLLETAWEALEDAGQMTGRLAGCAAGVFIGAQSHSSDYYLMQARNRERLDTYKATGTAHSILANRLSFLLDLHGPSMAVDTACSSSLVAVHLACQSLRARECDLAIAGGVNLMLTPDFHICLGKLEMMAPDGRCKTFDHRANGFVRGEGRGVVILKRVPDALRDRDPVLAVIVGSAVNQDGASNGLTAPSGPAQQAVVRRALEMGQVRPEQVGYIETHGTGTALGDPIEVEALSRVLGGGPGARACFLGALKTNLGHLEAASGIAGLIKTVLCLKHGLIPPNLHFEQLNPHIPLAGTRFVLPAEPQRWPRTAEPRFAGVSSFGFGGTNAHIVLSEAPESDGGETITRGSTELLLPISARSAPALRALAAAYVEYLTTEPGAKLPAADIAYTASMRRPHHDYQWCVEGSGPAEWAAALRRLLDAGGAIEPVDAEAGATIDWRKAFPEGGHCVQLPRYPWQRERCWLAPGADDRSAGEEPAGRTEPPADWFYELEWQPHGSLSREGSQISALAEVEPGGIAASLERRLAEVERECGVGPLAGLRALLDQASAGFIWAALAALGAETQPGSHWPKAGLDRGLNVLPRHARLFERLLDILAEARVLRDDGRHWTVLGTPPQGAGGGLGEQFAGARDVLRLHDRCGSRLADVLRGECDPLALLFPGTGGSTAEAIYRDAAPSRVGNRLAAEALRECVAQLPANRTLRVLELGGGTGGTTAALLPLVPADRCEYVFTDLSPLFLKQAARNFASYPFVRYELLDLERPPAEQGFGGGQFDLIIAANVVHATRDLAVSLGHARELLAEAGLLVLIECTGPRPWMDITFGLTEGWWRFTDLPLRTAHPLMGEAAWVEMLAQNGFEGASALPLQRPGVALFDQALLFARNGGRPAVGMRHGRVPARFLVFGESTEFAGELKRQIEARGDACDLVKPGQGRDEAGAGCTAIYLAGQDRGELNGAELVRACQAPLSAAQGLLAPGFLPGSLWLVTRGGQPVKEGETAAPEQSLLWGLGRGLSLEAPEICVRLVDLDPGEEDSKAAAALLAEIDDAGAEDQIAVRNGQRYTLRLKRGTEMDGPGTPLRDGGQDLTAKNIKSAKDAGFRMSGTHLVTGGLGGLGAQLALRLAGAGAEHLVLVVKRPLPERSQWDAAEGPDRARVEMVRRIEAAGARVTVAALDLADETALAGWFATLDFGMQPLRGIWHTAMSLSAAPLRDLTEEMVASMIKVKAAAAWRLHELSRAHALDQFVLYSSTTALWGAAGLAHYAAANAFLDALAHRRRAEGLPATVINWGTWDSMRGLPEAERSRAERAGLRPMAAEAALGALERILAAGSCQGILADIDWGIFKPAYESRRRRPLLERIGVETIPVTAAKQPADGLTDRLRAAAADERRDMLARHVQELLAGVLGIAGYIDRGKGFFELGMDSLTAIQLRSRLEKDLGRTLSSTLTFTYPTVDLLTDYLVCELFGDMRKAVAAAPARDPAPVAPTGDASEATEDELFEQLAARLSARRP